MDHVAAVWAAWAAGKLTDSEAEGLVTKLQGRPQEPARPPGTWAKPIGREASRVTSRIVPARPQRSPDRLSSRQRRRLIAYAGAMPNHLACSFTPGELAVLTVIAGEVAIHRRCDRSKDELAARSGTSRSTVHRALKAAQALGLVSVEERPRKGAKSLTNVVRITSAEWLAWTGFQRRNTTGKSYFQGKGKDAVGQKDAVRRSSTVGYVKDQRLSSEKRENGSLLLKQRASPTMGRKDE